MATDLRCPSCGDNFGKDKENPSIVECDCGATIQNPYGYDYDEDYDDEDLEEVSECCGAPIIHTDICSNCKEHCL